MNNNAHIRTRAYTRTRIYVYIYCGCFVVDIVDAPAGDGRSVSVENMEADVEGALVRRVKRLHGKAYKFISPGNAGVPDRIVVIPNRKTGQAHVWFVELKRPGKGPRASQVTRIRELRRLGASCCVIDDLKGVEAFVLLVKKELKGGDI